MDTIAHYREIILKIFNEHAGIPFAYGDLKDEIIVDREADRYLLMITGWDNGKRIHFCVIRIDIIDDKLWIQSDGTEYGVAADLERYGVPKEHIVLGFHAPDIRQYTEYAVA